MESQAKQEKIRILQEALAELDSGLLGEKMAQDRDLEVRQIPTDPKQIQTEKNEFVRNMQSYFEMGWRIDERMQFNGGYLPFNHKMSSLHQPGRISENGTSFQMVTNPNENPAPDQKSPPSLRCEKPKVEVNLFHLETKLYQADEINFKVMEPKSEPSLNDWNTRVEKSGGIVKNYDHLQPSDLRLLNSMPPKHYDSPFIRYVINSSSIPSFYNGIKLTDVSLIKVSDIIGQNFESFSDQDGLITVKAVTCRPGFADSEVAIVEFTKVKGIRQEAQNVIGFDQIGGIQVSEQHNFSDFQGRNRVGPSDSHNSNVSRESLGSDK